MTDKAYAVPLHELLASVPREARLVIDDDDGMGTRFIPVGRYCNEAAEALRARLAQPEPLPAKSKGALSHEENKQHNKKILDKFYEENAHLYTAPPQREWQGLTDEEIEDVCWTEVDQRLRSFARAIEAKLKEKNT